MFASSELIQPHKTESVKFFDKIFKINLRSYKSLVCKDCEILPTKISSVREDVFSHSTY